jgi:hypothetical protein
MIKGNNLSRHYLVLLCVLEEGIGNDQGKQFIQALLSFVVCVGGGDWDW